MIQYVIDTQKLRSEDMPRLSRAAAVLLFLHSAVFVYRRASANLIRAFRRAAADVLMFPSSAAFVYRRAFFDTYEGDPCVFALFGGDC